MKNELAENISVKIDYYNHRIPTPNWEILPDMTDSTNITYILDGEAIYYINGTPYSVHPGDIICTPPNTSVRAHTFPDRLVESQSIIFHIRTFDGSPYVLPFPLVTNVGLHCGLEPLYAEIQKSWLMREPGYKMHVHAYFMLILERLFQIMIYPNNNQITDSRIIKATKYIAAHYNETLTLPCLAAYVNLSPMYFGNLFKQQTGLTFRQYLTQIRLNQAEDMLRSGEYRVNEVASLCGFSDIFYFSKSYRKAKGISPSSVFQSPKKT